MTDNTNLVPPTITTWDGHVIGGTIDTTAHVWTADASGLFHTTANLGAEWTAAQSALIAGHGNDLTPLQRLEGNAQTAIDNTKLKDLPAPKLGQFREDLQREFDAIDESQKIAQQKYGIDPAKEYNTYTYLKVSETLQSTPQLEELAVQGHGTNTPILPRYSGYTTDFQNNTDNTTYYVGGGLDNNETAVPNLVDDVILSHTSFATEARDGVAYQLNQNGDREDPLSYTISGANEAQYERVLVASDFSTNQNAIGAVVLNTGIQAAPPLPVAGAGQITTEDASVISGTITTTPHVWVADSNGLFHTKTDLAAEWKADYKLLVEGKSLTSLQRQEANGEAVLENTGIAHESAGRQLLFREDLQRQFDAEHAAGQINQATLGISATAQFTATSYIALSDTIRFSPTLQELYTQGHGQNDPRGASAPVKYRGFTEDFQNNTDNETNFVGSGSENGKNALGAYVDEELLGHVGSAIQLSGGQIRTTQQNSDLDENVGLAVQQANASFFADRTDASSFKLRAR